VSTDTYDIYAVRYGHLMRNASANFIVPDEHDGPMPLDYFVWVIRNATKTYILDTGFTEEMGKKRHRTITRPVEEGLRQIGVEPGQIDDVIISHMHYDHSGNKDLFPNARYHIQDSEMAFCTGRCMCNDYMRHAFDAEDVGAMVDRLYEGRVVFHDGDADFAPGISLHLIGGHTEGLQCVRVKTKRGWVVLASDASHFYANFEQRRPFPVVADVKDMVAGYDRMRQLASSIDHIVPGHDPLVLERYPAAFETVAGVVRLDADVLKPSGYR
jgi:glyoxylase-like metal-dependent hydrolase (beta-lactamase superfamily II)